MPTFRVEVTTRGREIHVLDADDERQAEIFAEWKARLGKLPVQFTKSVIETKASLEDPRNPTPIGTSYS